MSSQVTVFLGPARSGKTHELLRQYRQVLGRRAGAVGGQLWLAPTPRAAQHIRQELIRSGLGACLNPGIMTFDDLASGTLAAASDARRLSAAMQRELLGRIVQSHLIDGRLEFFSQAAQASGFIDMLVEHIHELIRHGVSPQVLAATQPSHGDAKRHEELAAIYADYCRRLAAHRLVDRESALAATRSALRTAAVTNRRRLQLIVVDGFTDLTRTQHEILAELAPRTDQMVFELQTDAEPAADLGRSPRADLFAKTAATLAALRRYHPQLSLRHFAPRATNWPAADYLVEHVFRYPAPAGPLPAAVVNSLDQLEIVEAASGHDEIVQIARRVKQLLYSSGAAAQPDDVIVVFRSLGDAASRVREVFTRFGIPFALEAGEQLASAAVIRTLRSLIELARDDWPFRGVVGVLTNNLLTAIAPASRQAADWLVRELQVAKGRDTLLERVELLACDVSPATSLSEYAEKRVRRAKAALPALRLLAEALDGLPAEATASNWGAAMAELGSRVGLPPFDHTTEHSAGPSGGDDGQECPSYVPADRAAWQCVAEHFATLERLDTWLDQSPRRLTLRDALASLNDLARHGTLPRTYGDFGRVRVLSAITARSLSAKHVFLAGMSEQAFPAPERAGRLGTEAEYRMLSEAAAGPRGRKSLPLVTRSQEEMLLFYGVLACAQESLTISYPALDDKAQKLPASPYVVELGRLLGANERSIPTSRPQLSPVPAGESPWCQSEWRVQAVARALEDRGQAAHLSGLLSHAASHDVGRAIEAGLRIVDARARGESFGPAEGVLASPAASRRFTARFGPRHLWSPSQWEMYVACPFKFFLEHVLQLEPLGDLVLETDYSRRGSRLHDVLAAFHRQWSAAHRETRPSQELDAAAFIAAFRELVDDRMSASGTGIDAALLELDRRELHKWAADHFEHHARYQQLWSELGGSFEPAHFELRFGPARRGSHDADDPHSCDETFTLPLGDELVQVTGRIDRIDVARVGQNVLFNVIDYKSGRRASLTDEHIASGEHLQLPIYVAAAQVLVFGGKAEPLAAGYWTMASGFDAKGVLAVRHGEERGDATRWDKVQRQVAERVGRIIAAIRRGDFPVISRDDQCTSRCDFSTICRIAQVRSLGKTWSDDAERPPCTANSEQQTKHE